VLPLILMGSLDLNVEKRFRINSDSSAVVDDCREATFVCKLHVAPAFLELWIVRPSLEALQRLEMDGPVMTDFF
jgi:hypothetical protein